MNTRILLLTFGALFLAELGDKTQLAVITLAAQYKSPFTVFIGASLALIIVTLIGAYAGGFVTKHIPAQYIHITAGILFIIIGTSILVSNFKQS